MPHGTPQDRADCTFLLLTLRDINSKVCTFFLSSHLHNFSASSEASIEDSTHKSLFESSFFFKWASTLWNAAQFLFHVLLHWAALCNPWHSFPEVPHVQTALRDYRMFCWPFSIFEASPCSQRRPHLTVRCPTPYHMEEDSQLKFPPWALPLTHLWFPSCL